MRFGNRSSAEGWQELCKQASNATLDAWILMRTSPAPTVPNGRHHRMKGALATGIRNGKAYPQWQIEVTSGGRVWYLFDEDASTCWVVPGRAIRGKRIVDVAAPGRVLRSGGA